MLLHGDTLFLGNIIITVLAVRVVLVQYIKRGRDALSVTEAPNKIESSRVSGEETFFFFEI